MLLIRVEVRLQSDYTSKSVHSHMVFVQEPNAREYLQLALARVLELQREIKEGTYTTDHTSDLGIINLLHKSSV